jgi:hypothetical protein
MSITRGRGTAAEIAAYTGPAGQVVYDTTNKRLVLQDGETEGGLPISSSGTYGLSGRSAAGWLADRSEVLFDPVDTADADPWGWDDTNGVTYNAGTKILTMTGASAFLKYDAIPLGLDSGVFEAGPVIITPADEAGDQKLTISVLVGTTKKVTFELDPADNGVNVSGPDFTTDELAPANLDMEYASGFRVRLCVRPLERKAFLCIMYRYSSAGTTVGQQVTWFSDDYAWDAGDATGVWWETPSGGDGTVTLQRPVFALPSCIYTGSSIAAGHDEYSPYPGFGGGSTDLSGNPAYIFGQAFAKWPLNFGINSGGLDGVEGLSANILRFLPKAQVTDLGATNVINVADFDGDDLATLKADALTLIDAWIAAGCMVNVWECLPRNWVANDATLDGYAQDFNTWLHEQAAIKGFAVTRRYDAYLGVGTLPRTDLAPDGTHPGRYGKVAVDKPATAEAFASARFALA